MANCEYVLYKWNSSVDIIKTDFLLGHEQKNEHMNFGLWQVAENWFREQKECMQPLFCRCLFRLLDERPLSLYNRDGSIDLHTTVCNSIYGWKKDALLHPYDLTQFTC